MSKVFRSALVLDGSEIKYRIEAERLATNSPVHVDWVRFTALLRNAPVIPVERLFPKNVDIWNDSFEAQQAEYKARYRLMQVQKLLAELPDEDFAPAVQAHELALEVVQALGVDFNVAPEVKKGVDFYKFRWPLERNGVECGWVGFLASGSSPRQEAQAKTIHCNIFGMACTFAEQGWRERIADIVELRDAKLTRVDLALDFFDGYEGGIEAIVEDYNEGRCNVGGRLLKPNFMGDWSIHSKGARSFYFGSKEAGKETNAYEKGDQLFGVEAESPWLRIELRWGNKFRVLSVDMLRRPADFFACASDWHAAALLAHGAVAQPAAVPCDKRRVLETVQAECVRSITWCMGIAGATLSTAFEYLSNEQFIALLTPGKRPSRLSKFKASELVEHYSAAFGRISQPEGPPAFAMA